MTGLAATAVGPGLRARPWHRDGAVAYLTTSGPGRPTPDAIVRSVTPLREHGFRSVITPALDPLEQAPFVAAGFTVIEVLALLEHSLDVLPAPHPGAEIRLHRARRRDLEAIVAVDLAAFGPTFWHLGREGLTQTLRATPISRFRRAVIDGALAGYAIWGRAGRAGYLQRLAVAPTLQRHGVARTLVVDGLSWLHRRPCRSALVNTQPENGAALSLYAALGFERHRDGLAVLGFDLAAGP
jgi:ribosomal protein S18 acetylase RimI-like enzyme